MDAMEARYRLRDGAETIRQVFLAFDRRCKSLVCNILDAFTVCGF